MSGMHSACIKCVSYTSIDTTTISAALAGMRREYKMADVQNIMPETCAWKALMSINLLTSGGNIRYTKASIRDGRSAMNFRKKQKTSRVSIESTIQEPK